MSGHTRKFNKRRRPRSQRLSPEVNEILDELADVRYNLNRASSLGMSLGKYAKSGFLLKLLNNKRPMFRYAAIEALRTGDFDFTDPVIDALLSKIDDRRESVAVAAIHALGYRGIEDAVDELLSCVTMEDEKIAAASLNAVAEIGDETVPDLVEDFLNSEEPVRIRAAAQVIARHEMGEFAEPCLELLKDIRENAFIEPGKNVFNPYLLAARDLVRALGKLDHQPAADLLRELALEHYGLRSFSLTALKNLGVDDVLAIAKAAYEKQPSAKISRLLAQIDPAFEVQTDSNRHTHHLETNRELLSQEHNFEVGGIVRGSAVYVHRKYAIIKFDPGLSAFLDIVEFRWTRTSNLRDFSHALEEEHDYKITSLDEESGKIEVTRRGLYEDPLVEFQSRDPQDVIEGEIENIANFGVFVELEKDVVGLLHYTELDLANNERISDVYQSGDRIEVAVKSIDMEKRRIQLRLPDEDFDDDAPLDD